MVSPEPVGAATGIPIGAGDLLLSDAGTRLLQVRQRTREKHWRARQDSNLRPFA